MSAKRKSEHLWCTYSNVFSITKLVLSKKGKPLFDCLFYNCWCQNTLSWSGELLFLGIANFESMTQGSLNLHISQWQTVVLHALHVRVLFNFCTFHGRFRPFDDRIWHEFLCGRREDLTTICLPIFQFNSRIHRTHFAGMTCSKLFQKHEVAFSDVWRSRFGRRRLCLY